MGSEADGGGGVVFGRDVLLAQSGEELFDEGVDLGLGLEGVGCVLADSEAEGGDVGRH